MPQQKFTSDFININSPYRGLLLYHGLGVGKTCTSIACAESFVNRHKKVVILLPASLATNYKEEIMKCGSLGNPQRKVWSLIDFSDQKEDKKKEICAILNIGYAFAKKLKFIVWIPYLNNFPDIANNYIIIKNSVKWASLSEDEKEQAKKTIENIIDHKYTILNYNGLNIKSVDKYDVEFFKNSFVVIDEAHNFISRVVNNSQIGKQLYKNMMAAHNLKILLLTGTPVINHPYELALAINLIRGPINIYEFEINKTNVSKRDEIIAELESLDLMKHIDYLNIKDSKGLLELTLVPENYILNDKNLLIVNPKKTPNSKIIENIQKVLAKYGSNKKYKLIIQLALPNKKEDFENLFLENANTDTPVIKNIDLFIRRIIGTVSYFKSAGEDLFPSVSEKHIQHVDMSNYQFSKYILERDKERHMETIMKRKNKMKKGLFENKNSVYRAFSRMTCNFVFPETIKRPFPKDLRKITEEIDIVDEDEEKDIKEMSKNIEVNEKDVKVRYEEATSKAMASLRKNKDEYLNIDTLRSNYSPKMAEILNRIKQSPKTLLYSQFRTIEGLGVMELILEEAGWKRIVIGNTIDQEIFDPKYDNKRYIIFDNDRDKMKMLLQLYNGYFDKLPNNIQDQLNDLVDVDKRKNLRGELINLIMITQSGAEGISLKTVRTVLIMEPFWNMVRIDQVIGRAVRTYSHIDLPPPERHVDVYIFTSVLTNDQLKKNYTLKTLDNGLTSDTHIWKIAEKKDNLTQSFLNYLKSAAVDCRTHAYLNKPTKERLQCYAFPIFLQDAKTESANAEFAYIPNIIHDSLVNDKLERSRKIIGNVVIYKDKKYVIVNDNRNILYDYNAYKEAGVLQVIHNLNVQQSVQPIVKVKKPPSSKSSSSEEKPLPPPPAPVVQKPPPAPVPEKDTKIIKELLDLTEKDKRSSKSGVYQPKQEYQRLKPYITKYLKGPVDVGGAGDCQFRSLAKWVTGNENDHIKVRLDICNFIKDNEDFFTAYQDYSSKSSEENVTEITSDFEICNTKGNWGNNMSVQAAAMLYDVRIILVHKHNGRFAITYIENDLKDSKPKNVYWLYYIEDIHYQTYIIK